MNQEKIRKAFDTAMKITEKHLEEFEGGFPAPASSGQYYKKAGNDEWTPGFYTGLLWLFYEDSGKEEFKKQVKKRLPGFRERLEKRIVVDNHDMGFVYSLSCMAAYQLTGDEEARKTALLAADNLKNRFRRKGKFIQAWGKLDDEKEYRLIIDCLLNLPLLYRAAHITGEASYRECAAAHFQTAKKVLFREDFSAYHTYYFDRETGKPLYGATRQGYSDDSAWARGQAWGIYGLALNYPHIREKEICTLWKGVTDYFLAHLPKDLAAYWDLYFMEGEEPRDSSASAIAVCGIFEAYRQGICGEEYLKKADQILESLIDHYGAEEDSKGNGILMHSTYGRLLGEGIDEYCLWGDYFYVEALMRALHPEWKMYW